MSEVGILWLVTTITLLTFKSIVLVAGFFVIYLGKGLLEKGISVEFKLRSKVGNDLIFDLISASPGLLFILVGGIMVAIGIIVDEMLNVAGTSGVPPAFPTTPE